MLRNRRWVWLTLLLAIAGCGRDYTLVGRVVAVAGQPTSITEVVGGAIPMQGTPVAGATVTVFHELDGEQPMRASRHVAIVTTAADGTFHIADRGRSGTVNRIGLEVRARGHETAYVAYVDYAEPNEQYFLVVLRPLPGADR